MCRCVCRGEAFLVLLLKWCCCCSIIIHYYSLFSYHASVKQVNYKCDVALLAMSGRGPSTIVSAEVVMTGTQWQLHRAASWPGATLPASATPGPALARIMGAEEMDGGQQQQHLIRYDSGLCKCQDIWCIKSTCNSCGNQKYETAWNSLYGAKC